MWAVAEAVNPVCCVLSVQFGSGTEHCVCIIMQIRLFVITLNSLCSVLHPQRL